MSESKQNQRRTSSRVEFRAPIRVLSGDPSRACWAQSTNLSASGIHISSAQSFPVGAELALDIPLPGDAPGEAADAGLAFRCRVVWVERERRCGMGLEFLDLSDEERSSLRALVNDEELTTSWTRPVEIWFDGQPMPVSGTAIPAKGGIIVGLEMPHLMPQTLVSFRFTDDDSEPEQVGTLEGAHLEMGQVPRLVARVRPDEGEQDSLPTAPWAREAELDEKPAAREAELALEETASGEISRPDAEPETAPQTPSVADKRVPEPRAVEINGELAGLVERDPAPLEEPEPPLLEEPDPLQAFTPRPWRRRLSSLDGEGARNVWLWLAAIVMTGLALAAMSYTGLFDRLRHQTGAMDTELIPPAGLDPTALAPLPAGHDVVQPPMAGSALPDASMPDAARPDAPPPKPDLAGLAPRPDLAAAPPPKPDLAAPPQKPDLAAPAPKPDLAAATPPVARWTGQGPNPALIGKSTHLPAFRDIAGGIEVTIPVKGGSGQVKHAALSEPYGVSLYLAGARPSHRYGRFKVRGQQLFSLIKVQERARGLNIRLFFQAQRDLPYSVRQEPDKLILTVKE